MKAWVVWWGDEFCTLMHADTRGQAKTAGMSALGGDDFTIVRALRIKGLDDKPINYENALAAGFQYTGMDCDIDELDEEGNMKAELFFNDCPCDICKKGTRPS